MEPRGKEPERSQLVDGSRWNWGHNGRGRAWDSSSQDRAGSGSPETDQGCMAEADGGAEGLKGTSRVRAEGMAGFSGACRRGRLGEEAESVIDRTGGDEEHFVIHGTGDIKDSKLSGISDMKMHRRKMHGWAG